MLRALIRFFVGLCLILTEAPRSSTLILEFGIAASVNMSFFVPSLLDDSDKPWRPWIMSEADFLILEFAGYIFAAHAILYS